jgi:hypothetical protein
LTLDDFETIKAEINEMSEDEVKEKAISLLHDKNDLLNEVEELQEEIEKLETYIDDCITTHWSWDQVMMEFEEITDVNRALIFLWKVLREKSICENKECPAFKDLNTITHLIFDLRQNYESIFTLEAAKRKFALNKDKFSKWEKLYWAIRFKQSETLDQICTIGIPNETLKDNFFTLQDRTYNHELKIIEKSDKSEVHFDLNKSGDLRREAENSMITSADFKDGNMKGWVGRYQSEIEKKKKKKSPIEELTKVLKKKR